MLKDMLSKEQVMKSFEKYLKELYNEEWTEYDVKSQIGELVWKIKQVARLSNNDVQKVYDEIGASLFGGR
jgi:hypothetical protein